MLATVAERGEGNNAQLKQIGTAMRSKFRAEEKKVKMMQQRLDEVEAQLKETERKRRRKEAARGKT